MSGPVAAPAGYAASRVTPPQRTSDGALWLTSGTGLARSTDDGASWTTTPNAFGGSVGAWFVDALDRMHVMIPYNDGTFNRVGYKVGVLNAARTGFTFSTVVPDAGGFGNSAGSFGLGEVTAVCIAGVSYVFATAVSPSPVSGSPLLMRFQVDTANSPTATSSVILPGSTTGPMRVRYAHTGDGLTAAAAPHVFLLYSRSDGTGDLTLTRYAFAAGPSWTAGTPVALDSTPNGVGTASLSSTAGAMTVAYVLASVLTYAERNIADTVTTRPAQPPTPAAMSNQYSGEQGIDRAGNVYLYAAAGSATLQAQRNKLDRASGVWSGWTVYDAGSQVSGSIAVRPGVAPTSKIDSTYPALASSARFDSLYINTPPNAATPTAPVNGTTVDRAVSQRLAWTFSDPDLGDTQSAYDLQYRIGTGAFTLVTGQTANTFRDFAGAAFAAGLVEWQIRPYDSQGAPGPWSPSSTFTAADMPAGPTITTPTNNSTNPAPTLGVTWSAPTQTAYQVRTVGDLAGVADASTIYTDTTAVTSAATRNLTVATPVNGRVEHVQVRVLASGLWSAYADARYTVSFTPPATPALTAVLVQSATFVGYALTVTNPAPTGSQPAVPTFDVFRREVAVGGAGIPLARALPVGSTFADPFAGHGVGYAYLVRANGVSGATADSAWVTGP